MLNQVFWLSKSPTFWSRIASKVIDYCLFFIVLKFISLFLPFYIEEYYYYIFACFLPFFWIPLEALLVSKWGTTIGKKIFGLQIGTHIGGKLPYLISLKRSLLVGIRPGVIKQKMISIKRKILGFIFCFVTIFGASYQQELSDYSTGYSQSTAVEGWVAYTSNEGGFSVLFPNDPTSESKEVPIPEHDKVLQYNEFTSYQNKKVFYSVSYMQIPKKWKLAGASRILQGALEGIVDHTPNSTLLKKHFTKHQSHRALDFYYTQDGQEVQGRLIMVGTTVYRLTVTYPPSYANKLLHQEFLDSFEVQS